VREILHFPSPAESIAARARFDTAPLQPVDDYVEDYIDAESYDEPYEDGEDDAAPDSAEAAVLEYRERIEDDPAGTLQELGVSPVSDGAAEGYRIGDLAQSPYLSQTGLQPGDVILSINGRPVGDLDQDRLELDNVLAEGSARLEIQRGTRRFFVTASLQQ
jgi:type II secretory pathway component PulC